MTFLKATANNEASILHRWRPVIKRIPVTVEAGKTVTPDTGPGTEMQAGPSKPKKAGAPPANPVRIEATIGYSPVGRTIALSK